MLTKILMTILLSFSLLSCKGQTNNAIDHDMVNPLAIQRFDKDLFQWLESKNPNQQSELSEKYPLMLNIFGKAVLNLKDVETSVVFDKLQRYYSEPTLLSLYRDALQKYTSVDKIEKDLNYGFSCMKGFLPTMQIPAVYMHVSGLNQNVLVADSLLSLSIDKYLGADYPLYQDFFYEFQKRKMDESLVVPDYLSGWLMSEYPFGGKENVLLDRLIYEGKIKYVITQCLNDYKESVLMGYTEQELQWCQEHEAEVWRMIIERKHLYTPDTQTTSKYFEAAPMILHETGAPGSLGIWIGWQIVRKYMKETGASIETLMQNHDAQAILTASKYRP